jgi:ribosome-binding protein aMBF1 (putative translation factor)
VTLDEALGMVQRAVTELRTANADLLAERDALRAENAALRLALERTAGVAPDGTFGARLRDLREQVGISQLALGARVGASHAMVWRMEAGQRHPSREMIVRLARALHLTPSDAAALFDAAGHAVIEAAS